MDYARVLTGGVAGWLSFERACDRSGLFNEKYLTAAVGQILSARTGNRVEAEFAHPVLAPLMHGGGRRPAVDFVVRDKDRKIVLAVESKWAGKSIPTSESIVWDLIRLELIAHHEDARCLFLLAGTPTMLQKIFGDPLFSDSKSRPQRRPVLRKDNNLLHTTPLIPIVPARFAMFRRMLEPSREHKFPHEIVTRRTAPKPEVAKRQDYQVYCWEVLPTGKRPTFKPSSSKYFST